MNEDFITHYNDDPILCPDCGGTGCHPYLQATCRRCKGTGELTDASDDRYRMSNPRASSRCFETFV